MQEGGEYNRTSGKRCVLPKDACGSWVVEDVYPLRHAQNGHGTQFQAMPPADQRAGGVNAQESMVLAGGKPAAGRETLEVARVFAGPRPAKRRLRLVGGRRRVPIAHWRAVTMAEIGRPDRNKVERPLLPLLFNLPEPRRCDDRHAPQVDRELLRKLVRKELPRDAVAALYMLIDAFDSW